MIPKIIVLRSIVIIVEFLLLCANKDIILFFDFKKIVFVEVDFA